jgi:hypothetical protein
MKIIVGIIGLLVCSIVWHHPVSAQSDSLKKVLLGWQGRVVIDVIGDLCIPIGSQTTEVYNDGTFAGTTSIDRDVSIGPMLRIRYLSRNFLSSKSTKHSLRVVSGHRLTANQASHEIKYTGVHYFTNDQVTGLISRSSWTLSAAFEEGVEFEVKLPKMHVAFVLSGYVGVTFWRWRNTVQEDSDGWFYEENYSFSDFDNQFSLRLEKIIYYGFDLGISISPSAIKGFRISLNLPFWNNFMEGKRFNGAYPIYAPGQAGYTIGIGIGYQIN